ncbi:MAG: hypothetical protein ABIS67_12510 [Candidatus Eisenbacteria bacterium]
MSPERPLHRTTTMPVERSMDSRTLDAEKAEAAIRRAMQDGGTCAVEAEGRRRVLVHDPAVDAPLRNWPWPFTMIAPHRVRLIIYEDNVSSSSLTYERDRVGDAIAYFLGGLPPKAKVIISRQRVTRGRG